MFLRLLLLFTVVPLVELALLIKLGQAVGLGNTLAVVILTGLIGAALARAEGFGVLRRIQMELASGQLPGDSLLDGALVLAGGLLLLTPGLITDTFGLVLLLPFSRRLVKHSLKSYFKRKIHSGEIEVHYRVEDEV